MIKFFICRLLNLTRIDERRLAVLNRGYVYLFIFLANNYLRNVKKRNKDIQYSIPIL